MPSSNRDLAMAHEVPGKFTEHGFVLEMLGVGLIKVGVIWTDADKAVWKARAKEIGCRAALRHGSFRRSRHSAGERSIALLIFVERTNHVVEQLVRAAGRNETHFLREGVCGIG